MHESRRLRPPRFVENAKVRLIDDRPFRPALLGGAGREVIVSDTGNAGDAKALRRWEEAALSFPEAAQVGHGTVTARVAGPPPAPARASPEAEGSPPRKFRSRGASRGWGKSRQPLRRGPSEGEKVTQVWIAIAASAAALIFLFVWVTK
jgi:hypothetical protein